MIIFYDDDFVSFCLDLHSFKLFPVFKFKGIIVQIIFNQLEIIDFRNSIRNHLRSKTSIQIIRNSEFEQTVFIVI